MSQGRGIEEKIGEREDEKAVKTAFCAVNRGILPPFTLVMEASQRGPADLFQIQKVITKASFAKALCFCDRAEEEGSTGEQEASCRL